MPDLEQYFDGTLKLSANYAEGQGVFPDIDEDNFRLSKLNFDCLEKIIGYLSTTELLKLCQISSTVRQAINERGLGKREICFNDWNKIWTTETIFREIGGSMRFFKIGEQNFLPEECHGMTPFNCFMQFLRDYCTEDRIKALTLYFNVDYVDEDLLESIKPMLTNVLQLNFAPFRKLPNSGQDQLISTVLDAALKLRSIHLDNVWAEGDWLKHERSTQVQMMTLINTNIFGHTNWTSYFNRKPSLKMFAWIHNSESNSELCEKVATHCRKLQMFTEALHVLRNRSSMGTNFLMNRYRYLATVKRLKWLKVTAYMHSGKDLVTLFKILARKNTVRHLCVNFPINAIDRFDHSIPVSQEYGRFDSIKKLEIHNYSISGEWLNIIANFITNMVDLEEISIENRYQKINPVHATRLALAHPHLKVFDISCACVQYLDMSLSTIGKVRGQQTPPNESKLKVIVNSEQRVMLENLNFHNKHIEIVHKQLNSK